MSQHVEESHEDFKWGNSVPVIDGSGLKAYKSFTYKGVEYSLYDSIYTYRDGAKDTDIGKLVKLWESKKGTKRGKVVWFFRPSDICNFLRDYRVSWNELFLASGGGVGVSNVIPLVILLSFCSLCHVFPLPCNLQVDEFIVMLGVIVIDSHVQCMIFLCPLNRYRLNKIR